MRNILLVALLFFLSSCAGSHTVSDPFDKNAVANKIYESHSEFGEHRIYGPVIKKDFGNILIGDWVSVQLMKTENNNYYIRIYNMYGGKWKFLESITTLDKETIVLKDISRELTSSCNPVCYYTEIGFAQLDKMKYLQGNKDLKIRINCQKGRHNVITIPKQYIQAFMEKAG